MRLALVSDVHGRIEGLREAGRAADLFICLGDLLLFMDYDDPALGIFADLHGEQKAREFIALRTANRWDEARELSNRLWTELGGDTRSTITAAVRLQYAQVFEAMPGGLLTYGNVDVPSLWPDYLRDDHTVVDGSVVEVDGLRIGLVGGGLPSPMRTPYEIPEDEFDAKLGAIGAVDVLCSHIPPALPETTYDVKARRFERGSKGLLDAIRQWQPRYVLHGHVHSPLTPRQRIGRTEIINVGHFRSRRAPYVIDISPR